MNTVTLQKSHVGEGTVSLVRSVHCNADTAPTKPNRLIKTVCVSLEVCATMGPGREHG